MFEPTAGSSARAESLSSEAEKVCLLPTSLGQERFWVIDQRARHTPVLNVAVRFLLEGNVHPELVERAFNSIVARHETLRTTFSRGDRLPMQVIASSIQIKIPVLDLRGADGKATEAEVDHLCLEEAQKGFD